MRAVVPCVLTMDPQVINCLYYNPLLTLSVLEGKKATNDFFQAWFQNHTKLSRVHDKKLSVAALLNFITACVQEPQALESMKMAFPSVMKSVLLFLSTLPKAEEGTSEEGAVFLLLHNFIARNELLKMYGSDASDDSDDEEEEGDDGEEGVEEEDEDEEDATEETEMSEEVNDDDDVPDEEAEYLKYLAKKVPAM